MRKLFTWHYWRGVSDKIRSRFGRPRKLRPSREKVLTDAIGLVKPSEGVELVSLDVWSEGPRPCKEHCWHPVEASMKHKIAAGVNAEKHEDSICCRCTHGRCRIGANAVSAK